VHRAKIAVLAFAALLLAAGSYPKNVDAAAPARIRVTQSVVTNSAICGFPAPCLRVEVQGTGFEPGGTITLTYHLCDSAGACTDQTTGIAPTTGSFSGEAINRECGLYSKVWVSADGQGGLSDSTKPARTRC
jgi:hypothetical protein